MGGWVPALNVLAAVLSDSSYAIIVGALLASWWLSGLAKARDQPAIDSTPISGVKLGRLLMTCTVVLIACHVVHPWFVASSMSGSTRFRATLDLVPTILSSTRQGGLWYTNSLALAVLLGTRLSREGRAIPTSKSIEIAGLCVLAATKAASSHASEEGDFTLAEISQFLHILATSLWAGAIVVSGLLIVPRLAALHAPSRLWNYGHQLSKTVTWALGVLVLSGLYTSWSDMHGAINTLWTTPWGKTLATKVAFVTVAALLGSLTRFRCLGRPATGSRATTMTNLLRAEAFVMVAVLCLSGFLANTNPGT